MHHGSRLIARALAFCCLIHFALASSSRSPPLSRVHTPDNPSIRLARSFKPWQHSSALSRRGAEPVRIQHDDSFLLRFQIDQEPFTVVFRPVTTLLHPSARVNYRSADGGDSQSWLRAQDVRAFEGAVVHEHLAEDYWKQELAAVVRPLFDGVERGWARLLLREDDAWDGSMEVEGRRFTFQPAHVFERQMRKRSLADGPLLDVPLQAKARLRLLGGNTIILRSEDALDNSAESNCGHDQSPFNVQISQELAIRRSLAVPPWSRDTDTLELLPPSRLLRRQDIAGGETNSSFSDSIGDTSGCPKEQQVVYIGVAADCSAVSEFGSQDEARTQMLSLVNSVSGVYSRSFNVSVGVVELEVKDASCPTSANASEAWNVACSGSSAPTLNERLSLFSQWRGDKGGGDGAGLWSLVSNCATGSEVGVAWISQLCTVDASANSRGGEVTSGTSVVTLTDRTWEVMAHEIGHNFGAIHDCSDGCNPTTDTVNGVPCCPIQAGSSTCNADSNYIMSPVSSKNTTSFSPCTIGNICTTLGSSLNTTCLYRPGERSTLSAQQCGNGILEPGEECDPGSTESACCTSDCKLRDGAICDPSNGPCCTDSCQYAPTSRVCRPSVNAECDQAESCSGDSSDCPEDEYTENGTKCGDDGDGLKCAAGKCTSRDQQCKQQGSSMGITKACSQNSDTCQMTCANPSSSSSCLLLGAYFSDGLPCGLAGTCQDGNCKEGSLSDRIGNWIKDNKQYSIPILVVGSIVVLLILYSILRCCCGSCRKNRKHAPSAAYARQSRRASKHASNSTGFQNGPPMQQQQQQGYGAPSSPAQPQQAYHPPSYAPPPQRSSFAPPSGPPPGARMSS